MTDTPPSAAILVVDDERALADLYAAFLKPKYTVMTAYNGTEALEKINDEVDVALLDRRMPDLSGEAVLRAFREAGYECRVAMVTAVTPDIDIIEMGFDEYLTKPVDREDLYDTIERLLELEAYDDLMKEYYQLASKKAALETEKSDTALSNSDEFTQLTARVDDLATELRAREGSMSESDLFNVFD